MIGGVFLKAENPKFLSRWYEDHLGIGFGINIYFSFKWRDIIKTEEIGQTVLSFFNSDSEYFYPSASNVMLNLRVDNLDSTRKMLLDQSQYLDEKVDDYDYGRFGWTMDPCGNKIELWQAIDSGFEDHKKPMELFGKVLCLGGITILCERPKDVMNFYSLVFRMDFTSNSYFMNWLELENKNKIGNTFLRFEKDIPENSFGLKKKCLQTYIVENLKTLLNELQTSDVSIIQELTTSEKTLKVRIADPEGNQIELIEYIK